MDKWLWLFRQGINGLIIRRPKRAGNFLHSSSTCESYAMILLKVLPEVLHGEETGLCVDRASWRYASL